MERQFATLVKTLPDKVRLNSTRKNLENLYDLDGHSKESKEQSQERNCEKEYVGRTSSVYGNNLI